MSRQVSTRRIVATLLPILVFSACADGGSPESRPLVATPPLSPHYEEFFGHYVELCAESQYRSVRYGQSGIPGHALMYLKGACKDESASFPALRPCRVAATRIDDPEHGAGVSVNRWTKNVNWIAIPGHALFFEGNHRQGEPVTEASVARAGRDAIDAGVLDGVVWRDDMPTYDSLQELVEYEVVSTDLGLRLARTLYCQRLPVTDEMMGDIIDYLNILNQEYASGRADYDWNGISDNCAHLLRNALAAASIWKPRSVGASKFRALFHVAVPANEVVALAKLGTEGPLADGREVYRDDEARDALLDFDWLPRRHGALMIVDPVFEPNQVFDPESRLLVAEMLGGVTRTARRIGNDPRFTELRANLEYFRGVYAEILAQGHELIAGGFLPLRSRRYLRPTRRYFDYVESQLAEVEAMLERLDQESPSPSVGEAPPTR